MQRDLPKVQFLSGPTAQSVKSSHFSIESKPLKECPPTSLHFRGPVRLRCPSKKILLTDTEQNVSRIGTVFEAKSRIRQTLTLSPRLHLDGSLCASNSKATKCLAQDLDFSLFGLLATSENLLSSNILFAYTNFVLAINFLFLRGLIFHVFIALWSSCFG